MAVWLKNIEELLFLTLRNNVSSLLPAKTVYLGEIGEQAQVATPCICFRVLPSEGFLSYSRGRVRIWVWSAKRSDSQTILGALEVLLDHQVLRNTGTVVETVAAKDVTDVFDEFANLHGLVQDYAFRSLKRE